jgi:hypothetical protein
MKCNTPLRDGPDAVVGCSGAVNWKIFYTINGNFDGGGIDFTNIGSHGSFNEEMGASLCNQGTNKPYGCQFVALEPGITSGIPSDYLNQNQVTLVHPTNGSNATATAAFLSQNCTAGNSCLFNFQTDHWYYVEIHMKMNNPSASSNGVFKMWTADCGSDGTSCNSASPQTDYLRTSFTNVKYTPGPLSSSTTFNGLHDEMYASGKGDGNDGSGTQCCWAGLDGEWYFDQYVMIDGDVFIGPSIESINGSASPRRFILGFHSMVFWLMSSMLLLLAVPALAHKVAVPASVPVQLERTPTHTLTKET